LHRSPASEVEGELLYPFALIETNGLRRVLRFEAESQEEAIESAKHQLDSLKTSSDMWAFAREGIMRL
jgi:hypothetical protein